MAAVAVTCVGTEGGDLHLESPRLAARTQDIDHAKTDANGHGSAKQAGHFLRPGIRGDIVIAGDKAQKLVAHAAAGPQGLMPRFPHAEHNADRKLTVSHDRTTAFPHRANRTRLL